jgi:hypothetical protein
MTEPSDWPTREELAAYEVPGAPEAFAVRVTAAATETTPARASRLWVDGLAVAALVALVVVAGVVGREVGTNPVSGSGARRAVARETIALTGRGVAVLEAGAAIAWSVGPTGAAVIDQSAGAAFYRVEHGEPFEVRTPAGVVAVTGTCFAVALAPSRAVVTVYEGGVVLTGEGGELWLAASERGELRAGGVPRPAPDEVVTRAGELAKARADIAALERKLRATRGSHDIDAETGDGDISSHPNDPGRYVAPSAETLREMADTCWIAYDRPRLDADARPALVDTELATDAWLTDAERDAVNDAYARVNERTIEGLRKLHRELTGASSETTSQLSADALESDIRAKARPDEELASRRRVARERAGLDPRATPAELERRPVVERYLRLMIALGADAEAAAATVVGTERAHDLRMAQGVGWRATVSDYGGCKERR